MTNGKTKGIYKQSPNSSNIFLPEEFDKLTFQRSFVVFNNKKKLSTSYTGFELQKQKVMRK